jgi:hypothetical protein
MLAQPSSLSAPSLTGQNLAQSNLTASTLGQALGASGTSLLSPSVVANTVAGSDATSTSSQLSNALTKLAIAQHQQQQQAQQLQQQVAVNAALQAAASGASSTLLPSVASNMSLGNLKSTSVASSVLAATPLSGLEPIPSGAPTMSGSSLTSAGSSKVRVYPRLTLSLSGSASLFCCCKQHLHASHAASCLILPLSALQCALGSTYEM